MNNRSMPTCTIIPVLVYPDVERAIAWLCEVFGFQERWSVGNHRAQLLFDEGCSVVSGGGNAECQAKRVILRTRWYA